MQYSCNHSIVYSQPYIALILCAYIAFMSLLCRAYIAFMSLLCRAYIALISYMPCIYSIFNAYKVYHIGSEFSSMKSKKFKIIKSYFYDNMHN